MKDQHEDQKNLDQKGQNSQTQEFDTIIISLEEEGTRLDKILASRLAHAGSRTYFQYLIDEGKVLLNGAPVKKRDKPKQNDEVEIAYILTPELSLKAENIPLDVIYEDPHLLVVNKKAGMVVHPAVGHWSGTFVNALLYYLQEGISKKGSSSELVTDQVDNFRPGIVHRLDKDTSGLLMAAKTSVAQQKLIEMFSSRRIYKEYLAICSGNPGQGTVDLPIGRHPVHRMEMAILPEGGRRAVTHYKTLHCDGKLSVVSIVIDTGRTHQIRVHMKSLGTPVLGDSIYGLQSQNSKYGAQRQMLHASTLRFIHPMTGDQVSFEAKIPSDMSKLIAKIQKK